jgi:hypothetical protein
MYFVPGLELRTEHSVWETHRSELISARAVQIVHLRKEIILFAETSFSLWNTKKMGGHNDFRFQKLFYVTNLSFGFWMGHFLGKEPGTESA